MEGYEYILDKYREDILSICGVISWNRHIVSLVRKAIDRRNDMIEHYVNKLILNNLPSGKKIILFGCGLDCSWIDVILRTIGVEIVAYVDNSAKQFNNNIVYNLDEIRKEENEVFIIATRNYQDDIAKQLDDSGYKRNIDYIKFSDIFW
ncbi:hypothetical protein [Anaerovibrio sp. JC8]|uniref:hypothetical protein n=1 Tax=Anaerovibrio sp. JC8 TaxID=1240085 RepID=UPI001301A29C|nr:hypothetical protein [Anaerovibrio sp. JC8]